MQSNIMNSPEMEEVVKGLRGIINKYFSIEDVRWNDQAIAFYIFVDETGLEEKFDNARKELISKGFVPTLTREYNDNIIYITKKPAIEPRSVKVNIIMFILTVISTIWAGAVQWVPRTDFEISNSSFSENLMDMVATLGDPELVGYGALFFALPLMLILGVHELGHYYMSKKHSVDASLPFFIPIPPFIGPLGTFGAFISMREPMPSKKALMDIGAAGPIAGFIIAIPITIIGLWLTSTYPVEAEPSGEFFMTLGSPLIFSGLEALIPMPDNTIVHPTAFAGWVGILVTSMNLLPAGQLDGGHITRALFGKNSKYISYGVVLLLLVLGFSFAGWWIFTFLILMLGTSHPPPLNDITKLTKERKMIGVFAVIMMVICFVPVPISVEERVQPDFDVNVIDEGIIAGVNETVNFTLIIDNLGSERDTYYVSGTDVSTGSETIKAGHVGIGTFGMKVLNEPLRIIGSEGNETGLGWVILLQDDRVAIEKKTQVEFITQVITPVNAENGDRLNFTIEVRSKSNKDYTKKVDLSVVIGELSLRYDKKSSLVHPDTEAFFEIEIKNTGSVTMTVILWVEFNKTIDDIGPDWQLPILNNTEFSLQPFESKVVEFGIRAPDSAKIDDNIIIDLIVENKDDPSVSDSAGFELIVD